MILLFRLGRIEAKDIIIIHTRFGSQYTDHYFLNCAIKYWYNPKYCKLLNFLAVRKIAKIGC